MDEIYLICEDSLEGIFTGVYEAYLQKRPLEQVHLILGEDENYRLFATYQKCRSNDSEAAKVARTIQREFGTEAYLSICRALASHEKDKAEAILRVVVEAFRKKKQWDIMGNLKDPYVHRVFELARNVANEIHFHIEFLRFEELDNGILYAQIGPKNNVLTFITPHFADRLPLENFVIHDKKRKLFAVHEVRKDWYLVHGQGKDSDFEYQISEGEEVYSELFYHFFKTIAIKERTNLGLQRNMLPIRYREYMTEFNKAYKFSD